MASSAGIVSGVIQIRLEAGVLWQEARSCQFDIIGRTIVFKNEKNRTISTHTLPPLPQDFHFWSKTGDVTRYKPYNLTSLVYIDVQGENRSNNNTEKLSRRPTYSFTDRAVYRLFQSQLRKIASGIAEQQVNLVGDFDCVVATPHQPNGARTYIPHDNFVVKIWQHSYDNSLSFTLSLMSKSNAVIPIELRANEVRIVKRSSSARRLYIHSAGLGEQIIRAPTSGSAKPDKWYGKMVRRYTAGTIDVAPHGQISAPSQQQVIPGVTKIELEFADPDLRKKFLEKLDSHLSRGEIHTSDQGPKARTISPSSEGQASNPNTDPGRKDSTPSNEVDGFSTSGTSPRSGPQSHVETPLPVNVQQSLPECGSPAPHRQNKDQTTSTDRTLYSPSDAGTQHGSDRQHDSSSEPDVERISVRTIPSHHHRAPTNGSSFESSDLANRPQERVRRADSIPPIATAASIIATSPDDIHDTGLQRRQHTIPRNFKASDLLEFRRFKEERSRRRVKDISVYWKRQDEVAPLAQTAHDRALSNQEFYHEPLPAGRYLRILTICKAEIHDPLVLSFSVVQLDQAKFTYEALSYSWGPGLTEESIKLNGGETFKVSTHLANALRHIRLPQEDRAIWVDAICINQMSLEEMNQSVGIMGEIYQCAWRTLVWFDNLGARHRCEKLNFEMQDDQSERKTLCMVPQSESTHGSDELRRSIKEFLNHLKLGKSANAWHLRMWCVQEFYFSQKDPIVYIGRHAIGWQHFVATLERVSGHESALAFHIQLREWKQTQKHLLLQELCTYTGSLHCGDLRDRIYSLAQMSKDPTGESRIETMYESSPLQVYEDATLFMIQQSRSLNVLIDGRADRTVGKNFGPGVIPTYIPDFTQLTADSEVRSLLDYRSGHDRQAYIQVKLVDDRSFQTPKFAAGLTLAAPRLLRIRAKPVDLIAQCTNIRDHHALQPEKSPSGQIIYSTLQQPGRLIEYIYETLKKLDFVGRLMVEYLVQNERDCSREVERCTSRQKGHLRSLIEEGRVRDNQYIQIIKTASRSGEQDFVERHWARRKSFIADSGEHADRMFDLAKMVEPTRHRMRPWSSIISQDDNRLAMESGPYRDVQAGLEYENLFLTARKEEGRYYMFNEDCPQFYRPMRGDVLRCQHSFQDLDTQQGTTSDVGVEMHEYSQKAREREFLLTEKQGYTGLGPATMEPGDLVVIVYGASRPWILRACESPQHGYTFVGEALIPAIMHGEWLTEDVSDEWYELR